MAVVAIIAILAGVGIVAILTYLRSMTKMQYDDYAKEIFIAAQNHLAMAESQGYLGREEGEFGIKETGETTGEDPAPDAEPADDDGIYYFIVNAPSEGIDINSESAADSVLTLMLPHSAIDEAVRAKGCYIIRYQKLTGRVLDVFYWETTGRYAQVELPEYEDLLSKTGPDNKSLLKTYGDEKSVIGWYGDADAAKIAVGKPLNPPLIELINAERLIVKVTNTNVGDGYTNMQLNLEITGNTSGKHAAVRLIGVGGTAGSIGFTGPDANNVYTVVLDDITDTEITDRRFAALLPDMIPGEDITVRAVAFNNQEFTNVAYSAQLSTNSIFGDNTSVSSAGTADIANFRHLENLDPRVSGVNEGTVVVFTTARQSADLIWWEDRTNLGGSGFIDKTQVSNLAKAILYDEAGSTKSMPAGSLLPVEFPDVPSGSSFTYDGGGHSVSKVLVQAASDDAGLFGNLTGGAVKNLKLVDFDVSGGNAGALAGSVSGVTVTNVLAVNSTTSTALNVTGSSNAGGLIGNTAGTVTVTKCAAALIVKATGGDAGGLIGAAGSGVTISACYAAGHTAGGAYSGTAFNVIGSGSAGGLVGSAGGAAITCCYSTCSVSGANAGGLVGSGSGAITSCYAAGLVSGTTTEGAFAGNYTGTPTGCWYFEIINERPDEADGGYTYMTPLSGGTMEGIKALDADAATYNSFVGNANNIMDERAKAAPYDKSLQDYYTRKYQLKTVAQLGDTTVAASDFVTVHYGDWPAPELWVVKPKAGA